MTQLIIDNTKIWTLVFEAQESWFLTSKLHNGEDSPLRTKRLFLKMTLKLLRIQYFRGFPDGSVVKNPPAIQEPGRCPGERNAKPLQYSCLESPMDRGAWWAAVHWVAKEADTSATEQQCFQIRYLSPYPILQNLQGQLYLYFFFLIHSCYPC